MIKLSSTEIDQLTLLMIEHDKKAIQTFLRSTIEELIKTNSQFLFVWQGWLAAIERNESASLFNQLIQGISKEDLAKNIHEFSTISSLLEEEDPIQIKNNSHYLKQWKYLLRSYRKHLQ